MHINSIFEVLNTPEEDRQVTIDQDLQAFPYINGGLFERTLRTPSCNSVMRRELLAAASLNWSAVSPAIFGSMFQGVMDETQRRNLGAHYTSERNILRVIKPLFLDDLYMEYARARLRKTTLEAFHKKLSTLNFLDPACGCGNFLVITYRELRRLEHKVVQDLFKEQRLIDVSSMLRVNVNQMHGIEIEEFPSRIAQTALWLTDHQMNMEASALLGQHYVRLPLTASANIVNVNALTTDWEDVVPAEKLSYILGNPPFNGSRMMSREQKSDLLSVTRGMNEEGFLDLVCGWYLKAVAYIQHNHDIRVALVSTNSITQGEQASILWQRLLNDGVHINFGHRTFKWLNEAKGVAAVYCVVVGFSLRKDQQGRLFDYPDIKGDPVEISATNINPYLVDAPNVLVSTRQKAPLGVPEMTFGSMPRDGGNLILSKGERDSLLASRPDLAPLVKKYTGAKEFINGYNRYCLWLTEASPSLIKSSPFILDRIKKTRAFRLLSRAESTRNFARSPGLFCQIAEPGGNYLLVPRVSSESRDYIPVGYVDEDTIGNDQVLMIRGATLYHFGILNSTMHMAWVRAVCGRLKSDYRYSKDIVYNNFPWPVVTPLQKQKLSTFAQAILDARESYPENTLADLYNPLTMPTDLRKAHDDVDRYVDRLYRKAPFDSDADRVALLFKRYQELTAGTS